MIRYYLRSLRVQFRNGKVLWLLSLFGVSLGVASVITIQIINFNAFAAFRGSMQAISGSSDLTVVGTFATFREELYPRVLETDGIIAAWPIHRVDVALVEDDPVFLEVIGVDFFLSRDAPWNGLQIDASDVLGQQGWAMFTPSLARERGWQIGDRISVTVGTRRVELVIGAFSNFRNSVPSASPRIVLMDLAQAQSLFGTHGELHQIDVKLANDARLDLVVDALEHKLGDSVRIITAERREHQVADLLSAFRLNLLALSMVSVFVGGFLVFSSVRAALVRRRTEFGLLRSIGATRRQLMCLLLGDVALLGFFGIVAGLPLGYFVALVNVDKVSATLSNLYLLEEIHQLEISPWVFVLGSVIGFIGAGLGALGPAVELGRKDIRSLLAAFSLHEHAQARVMSKFWIGIVLLILVFVIYLLYGSLWRPAGFVQAFLLVMAIPLLVPCFVRYAARLSRVSSFGFAYGVQGLGRHLDSTSTAVSALAIAVSMVVGVTVMIGSFRHTLEVWISNTIQADIYISTHSSNRSRGNAGIDNATLEQLVGHPSVEYVDRLRQLFANSNGRRFFLSGVDGGVPKERFHFIHGGEDEIAKDSVLVGEPLAHKIGVDVGDNLVVDGPKGKISIPITGIYYDYSSELGSAFMNMETFTNYFGERDVNSVALYLSADSDVESVIDELKRVLGEKPVRLRSNRGIREGAMLVFEQTFSITKLLHYLSLFIAVCGITLSLVVLARERSSELALYRALGTSRLQIFRVYLGKGLGIGIAGLLLGTVSGVGFGFVLTYVVNPAFFGWTIALHWPIQQLIWQTAVILLSSQLASLYPALCASRIPATELRREDL